MGYCTGGTGPSEHLHCNKTTQYECESYPWCTWVSEGSGDVNLDGQVNIMDVVGILEHTLGTTPIQIEQALINADVNGDGFVNIEDITNLIQNILGLNPTQSSTVNNQLRQLSGTTNRMNRNQPLRSEARRQSVQISKGVRSFGGRTQNNPKGRPKR